MKALLQKPIFWALLAFAMLAMNLLPNDLIDPFQSPIRKDSTIENHSNKKKNVKIDLFDQQLANNIKNVDNLVLYTKQHVQYPKNKHLLLEQLVNVMRHRFIHAYGTYGMQENWIAVLTGKFIWRDLAAKVIPNDILKGDAASCSQVSLIIMAACQQLGITTRKVGLVGHYTLEANIDNKWYFVDADLKPDFNTIGGRKSLEEILKNKDQFSLYANTILDSSDIIEKFSEVEYGKPNIAPAPKAYLFQITTQKLSHWGWLIPMILSIITLKRKERYQTGYELHNHKWVLQ